ncbi:MAG: hypothetical protein GY830_10025 [Bacteroidetes bacterium]|nr:hypothetical protein [Bacteroidota bacterium]
MELEELIIKNFVGDPEEILVLRTTQNDFNLKFFIHDKIFYVVTSNNLVFRNPDKIDCIVLYKLNSNFGYYSKHKELSDSLNNDIDLKIKKFFDKYFHANYEIWTKTIWNSDSKYILITGKAKIQDLIIIFVLNNDNNKIFPLCQWGNEDHLTINFPIKHEYRYQYCVISSHIKYFLKKLEVKKLNNSLIYEAPYKYNYDFKQTELELTINIDYDNNLDSVKKYVLIFNFSEIKELNLC